MGKLYPSRHESQEIRKEKEFTTETQRAQREEKRGELNAKSKKMDSEIRLRNSGSSSAFCPINP
jgi:hypothetical protein